MNSRNRQIYLLTAISLFAAGCVAVGERRTATITRSWPAASVQRIDVHEIDGSVDVTATAGSDVSLVAHVRSRGFDPDPKKENSGYFETSLAGGTLAIGHRHGMRIRLPFFTNSVSVDYELRVPPSVALELKTINGRIATRGIDSEMQATSVNGTLDLEMSGSRELTAHTVNGRVRARFLRDFQGAHLKTVNGSVEAVLPPTASFACDLSQVNGDFEASFPLSIHSHPGSRRVSGEINGGRYDLRITTVNGDIHVENSGERSMALPPLPPNAPVPPVRPATAPPAVPSAPPSPVPPLPTTR
jgi:hypothetical protein